VRLVDGTARSLRVIGKGDKERLVPLPAFGAVFGFWLKDRPNGEFVFARAAGQPPATSQAARADRRGILRKAAIEKKVYPYKLRYIYATNRLNAGADRVDLQALLGHESLSTTQIDSHVGQARMEQVVGWL
jgi:integrase/recombinase XerD